MQVNDWALKHSAQQTNILFMSDLVMVCLCLDWDQTGLCSIHTEFSANKTQKFLLHKYMVMGVTQALIQIKTCHLAILEAVGTASSLEIEGKIQIQISIY